MSDPLDVLDGKKLVCPIGLTAEQAKSFRTLMPIEAQILNGERRLAATATMALPMHAWVFFFQGGGIRLWSMN